MREEGRGLDSAAVAVDHRQVDGARIFTHWTCEKWEQDACDWVHRKVSGLWTPELRQIIVNERINLRDFADGIAVPSSLLRMFKLDPEVVEVPGNLFLNEGIQRLWDLGIAAGGTAYNNANAFIGVGDTNTAAAATQTELQATQNAANRFYKGMVASYPQRTNQTVDWRSDFTSTEANFAWAEWTVAAGATTASGSGFLVGTTNLNRKVESLGTKATGTWTLTASLTIA